MLTNSIRLAAVLACCVVAGCGGTVTLTDVDKADIRAFAAAAVAVRTPATPDAEPDRKVPRSECRHCRGTGKVKSGDGLATVPCPHCEPDTRDGGGGDPPRTDAADLPFGSPGGRSVPVFPNLPQPSSFVPPEPDNAGSHQIDQDASDYDTADGTGGSVATRQRGSGAVGLPIPESGFCWVELPDRIGLDDLAPADLGDDLAETGEPKAFLPTIDLGFDAAVDGLLDRMPERWLVLVGDGSDASKADPAGAGLLGAFARSHWPVMVVDRRRWPELAERLCVEESPCLLAIHNGTAVAKLVPTVETTAAAEELLADAWPDLYTVTAPAVAAVGSPWNATGKAAAAMLLRQDIEAYRSSGLRRVTGISGMTARTHLVRDHGWPAELVDELTGPDQNALHDATHQGLLTPAGYSDSVSETGKAFSWTNKINAPQTAKPTPPRTSRPAATSNCPTGNCPRPAQWFPRRGR